MTRIGLRWRCGPDGADARQGDHAKRQVQACGGLRPGTVRPGSVRTWDRWQAWLRSGYRSPSNVAALCAAVDVVVDYSAASATIGMLPVAIGQRKPVVVGTTGFDAAQHAALVEAGKDIPIMLAANMSVSVIAMYELVRTAARLLGDEFDIEIFDFHPRTKIDAPSGTAIELANTRRRRGDRRSPS